MDVMTAEHPRWEEFRDRLEGPEGCDFQEDEDGKITWLCRAGRDKSKAIAILERMGGFNISASLAYFEDNGGYCDCEILFNVPRPV